MRRPPLSLLLVLALLVPAAPAAGHASLQRSEPATEEVLAQAPERLELEFSNRVSLAADAVQVLDAKGAPLEVDVPAGSARRFVADLPDLAAGAYVVAWRVTDDHGSPVTGAWNFHVGAGPGQPAVPAAPRATRTASDELRDLSRTGLIVALVALGIAAGFWFARRRHPEGGIALASGQAALACAALAAAGLLVVGGEEAKAPPSAPGAHLARLANGNVVDIAITPPRVGAPRVTVDVRAANGQPDFAPDRVTARLTHEERKLGPFNIEFPKRQVGRFEPELLTFPYPGRWKVELSLESGDFDAERVVFTQEVAR